MDMSNILLVLEIPCNIGEMTQKKISVLQEHFSSEFESAVLGNDGVLIIEKEDRSANIVLASNLLQINIVNYSIEKNESLIKYLTKLSNIFMLDDIYSIIVIRFVSQTIVEFNTMNKTKEFGKSISNDKHDKLSGIGFRYIFENDANTYDEFKFEPFLADHHKFYSEAVFNNSNINMNDISTLVNEKVNIFNELNEGSLNKICN